MTHPQIETAIDYYADPAVSRALLSCWGCPTADYPDLSLTDAAAAACLEQCTVAYLAVSSLRIAAQKQNRVPFRAIRRWKLPAQFQQELNGGDGALEINQPLGYFHPPPPLAEKGAAEQWPERTLLFLDIEAFNADDATWAFKHPRQTFRLLEGAYQTLLAYFVERGIDALVTVSGRGYHFVSRVPWQAPAMEKLAALGHHLSPEVRHFLNNPRPGSKRQAPIPLQTERAFWGMRQLEHFIYTQTIGTTRRQTEAAIEMSDRGRYGVSFDATSMNRTTETAGFGCPASVYTKPQVRYRYSGRFPTRSVRAVIQDGAVHEYGGWQRMLQVRGDYREAAANAAWWLDVSPAGIPDGSRGVARLIAEYEGAALAGFHGVMNEHYRLPPEAWRALVQDVGRAALEDERVGRAAAQPNAALLEPDSLNDFVFGLFERWRPRHGWRALKRVSFILSAFYYNEPALLQQFQYEPIDWGRLFNHEVPQRHAQAWVMILGGQLFEA